MWPQTHPRAELRQQTSGAFFTHLVQSHYPAELDLPGVRAVVCLLNSFPIPSDEMIACKTTGNYGPFKSLGRD